MTKREDLLSRSWTGPQLEIGGKPVIMSPVRYSILEYWKNSLFDSSNTSQTSINAMGELLLICSATREEIKELKRMTPEQRAERVVDFMLDNEKDFSEASNGIQERLESIRASMVESESPGKEEAQAHVF
jgi:hypothetical protein